MDYIVHPQDERKALIETVRAAHQAVCTAGLETVRQAIIAGTALLQLKAHVKHGEWANYIQQHCAIGGRTCQVYMRIAENRAIVEAKAQRAADLSLRAALKLITDAKKSPGEPSAKKKTTTALSTLAWANATAEQRQDFLNGVGLVSLLAAIPPAWRIELERRVEGQRRATNSKLSDAIAKALRQALSLQKAHKDKDGMALGVAAALNAINNLIAKAGADLNEISEVTFDERLTKANAA